MFNKGQVVERIYGGEFCHPAIGSRAFVDEVKADHITLEGHLGVKFLKSHFKPVDTSGTPSNIKPSAHELLEALHVVDRWNKLCPTGLLISIEGHEAVNGGSVFDVGGRCDSNNPEELFDVLVGEITAQDFQAQLQRLNQIAGRLS